VLVISHDALRERSELAIILAITASEQRAGSPLVHRLRGGGLPRPSWVIMSQVRTIPHERLRERIGVVDAQELEEIVTGLIELIG